MAPPPLPAAGGRALAAALGEPGGLSAASRALGHLTLTIVVFFSSQASEFPSELMSSDSKALCG